MKETKIETRIVEFSEEIVNSLPINKIDDELLPLILAMNQAGIKTRSCCSGHTINKASVTIDIESLDSFFVHDDSLTLYFKCPIAKVEPGYEDKIKYPPAGRGIQWSWT